MNVYRNGYLKIKNRRLRAMEKQLDLIMGVTSK